MNNDQIALDVLAMREALIGLLAVTARRSENPEGFLAEVSSQSSAAIDVADPRSEMARAGAALQHRIDALVALAKLRL